MFFGIARYVPAPCLRVSPYAPAGEAGIVRYYSAGETEL